MRRLSIPGLCLLALLAAVPAWALDPARRVDEYTLAHWTMEDGLPHNLVHTISQDAEGYLWAGTGKALRVSMAAVSRLTTPAPCRDWKWRACAPSCPTRAAAWC